MATARRSLTALSFVAAALLSQEASAITRCQVIEDAESWVAAGVPYSQGKWGSYCPSDYCYSDPLRPGPSCWRSDCSGFVSATWNVQTSDTYSGRSTLGYAPFDTAVSYELGSIYDLLPGDALNNDGHIMLFGGWTGADTFFIYQESTCEANVGTTVAHRRDFSVGSSYVATFHPIRYVGIEDCNPNKPPSGSLDSADGAWVRGWAQDPNAPDDAIAVHLYFDGPAGVSGAAIAMTANVHRDDLCGAIGSCAHGYLLRTPPGLCDGKGHQVYAYAIDSQGGENPLLAPSPLSFTCEPPAMPLPPERAVRRWVTSGAIFDQWRFSQLDVVKLSTEQLSAYRRGPDLGEGPRLVRRDGAPEVYLVDGGKKRWVMSFESLAAWRLNAQAIEVLGEAELAAMPEGPRAQLAPMLVQGGGAEVWLIDERPEGGTWLPSEESAVYDSSASSDVDGDGRADVCARAEAGFVCQLSGDGALAKGPALDDAAGFGEASRWSTIRMGDVDGDGRADVCARGEQGVRCWASTGQGFADKPIEGPPLGDAQGWGEPRYHATIRLIDYTGDGKADICARAAKGVVCWPSTGQGFGAEVEGPKLSDEQGWADESNWGALLTGDVNGDGREDLCARANTALLCWLSTGDGFGDALELAALSDEAGYLDQGLWASIRLADIDGDKKKDVCARTKAGFSCFRSTGTGFGPAIEGPALSDDKGWSDPSNWSTIRVGDVTGDGKDDLCARADAGFTCWASTGAGFGESMTLPSFADSEGFDQAAFYRTIRLADIDADGRADVCGRKGAGVSCWLSDGKGFTTEQPGPAFAAEAGFAWAKHHATLRVAGGKRASVEMGQAGSAGGAGGAAGSPQGAGGAPGGSAVAGASASGGKAAAAGGASAASANGVGGNVTKATSPATVHTETGAEQESGCDVSSRGRSGGWLLVLAGLLLSRRRR